MNLENRIPHGSYFQYSPTGIHGPLQRSSSLTDRERSNLDSCFSILSQQNLDNVVYMIVEYWFLVVLTCGDTLGSFSVVSGDWAYTVCKYSHAVSAKRQFPPLNMYLQVTRGATLPLRQGLLS
ncbi:hypothetical protein H5410_010930 [Solanum commersonii]|uniref:Uncharacterized protein n=1 Tax=Solanum commersonii TaxID=4109 RepID=A0A9J6AM36_SOLCO|nr:hypothetical protein H5410_010930 [Solanum commersonii]